MLALRGVDFPAWWVILLCIGACLFVWQFGLRAPRLGLISMERLPQIGLLLVFDPAVAASICARGIADLAAGQPPLQPGLGQGGRATRNPQRLDDRAHAHARRPCLPRLWRPTPAHGLLATDLAPLIAMALTAQAVNIVLMTLFFRFDGREVRRIVTPSYALSDLIFVPAGILAAVLYNTGSMTVFWLFAGLMLLFVLSLNSIGSHRDPVQAERGPLTRVFEAGLKLQGARRVDDLAERILAETRALFRFDELYLVLVDRERRLLDIRLHERQQVRMPPRLKSIDTGLFGWLIARAEPLLVEDCRHAPPELLQRAEPTEKDTGSLLAVPLVNDGIVLGLLSVQHTQPAFMRRPICI